jgi:hypothetical protein
MSAFKSLLRQIEQAHVTISVGNLVSLIDPPTAFDLGYDLAGLHTCDITHALYVLLRDLEMHDSADAMARGHREAHQREEHFPCAICPATQTA